MMNRDRDPKNLDEVVVKDLGIVAVNFGEWTTDARPAKAVSDLLRAICATGTIEHASYEKALQGAASKLRLLCDAHKLESPAQPPPLYQELLDTIEKVERDLAGCSKRYPGDTLAATLIQMLQVVRRAAQSNTDVAARAIDDARGTFQRALTAIE